MAQLKIYGYKVHLEAIKLQLSDAIHSCLIDAFELPEAKRFHRFIALNKDDFIHPEDRTECYIILEITMFTGRSVEAKKKLIYLLYERLELLGIFSNDLEIIMIEMPRYNWGIRGMPADELSLSYRVDV